MMITGKIIEKAEEEEESSVENLSRNSEEDYEEDFDFDQYKEVNEDILEPKKILPVKHLSTSLKDKAVNKRERCEFCNLLIPSNKIERHIEEWNNPQSKKLVLNVKSIKFAERVPNKKKLLSKSGSEYSESFEGKMENMLMSVFSDE